MIQRYIFIYKHTHTKTKSAVSSETRVRELCEYEFMLGFVQMGDLKYGFIPVGGM